MAGKEMADGVGPRADTIGGRATLAVSNSDTEAEMTGKERWEHIHQMHRANHSVSAIARELEMDRKTVRYWLGQTAWVPYRRQVQGRQVLALHRAWLAERAPQVGYSARILYQELVAERGYTGGYDTVKNAVRPLRTNATLAALTQRRFETGPGEQAQVDWGQVKVRFPEGPATVHVFVMTLGYSRRAYVEGYENERMASLLAAHEHAFAHFGGRCAELLYDRMRTVVLGSEAGKPVWNTTFEAFARHWGFEARLCRPYRAQTKGKVESGVKYVKRNFVPGRVFRNLDDFNEQLRLWSQTVADLRIHGTTHQRPIDRYADEAHALVPTAGQASFLDAMVRERVVAEDWLVSIDSNRYRGELVAEHAVLAGRHQLSVQPMHGPGAVARNARQPAARRDADVDPVPHLTQVVEVRDLAVYDQTLEAA